MRLFLGAFAKIYNYDFLKNECNEYFEGKMVEKENLHTTLYFLGEMELKDAMESLEKVDLAPLKKSVELKGLKLKKKRKGYFLYAAYKSKRFSRLNKELSNIFKNPGSGFLPHVTVMRVKSLKKDDFPHLYKKYKNSIVGKVERKIALVQSILSSNGPVYKIVKSF